MADKRLYGLFIHDFGVDIILYNIGEGSEINRL